ncbi:uncharacterized protein FOMMEDRAFT_170792 [Fomitiporia mediterranea MF3/22]|uniref:uncharacterized protein n=1 Tax=Fomitiporia mediterranea (strain MF3/22) TaxID=694068 RepID=UPI0004408D05|nr:uncharacterized protein FOMMEDRAFT_170792 [Fomitiporia mediterranea MF3/22]EJC99036.1 hypothetical protein FOMMEDRAFT_170792 [Fomitiporia mediterranea MF3/22]
MSGTTTVGPVHDTLGCLMIGSVLSMGLYGIGSVQTYYFFDTFGGHDSYYLRFQVFSLWALNTVHQAFILCSTYKYAITHYAVAGQLAVLEPTLRNTIILTAVIAILAQSVFVDRIYCLSKNLILTAVMIVLALGQLACTIAYYAKCHSSTTFDSLRLNSTLMHVDQIITAVVNSAIAGTLVYLFQTTRTGFKQNDSIANKFMAFGLNTGAVTAICAIVCLVTGYASPNTFVYLLFSFLLTRLYMNTVLASLNSRSVPRDKSNEGSGLKYNLYDMRNNRTDVSSHIRPTASRVVTIKVDTETFLESDGINELGRVDRDGDLHSPYSKSSPKAY